MGELYLLTGAAGHLGTALVKLLKEKHKKIRALVLPEELDAELQPASKPAQSTAARAALINFVVFFMGAS